MDDPDVATFIGRHSRRDWTHYEKQSVWSAWFGRFDSPLAALVTQPILEIRFELFVRYAADRYVVITFGPLGVKTSASEVMRDALRSHKRQRDSTDFQYVLDLLHYIITKLHLITTAEPFVMDADMMQLIEWAGDNLKHDWSYIDRQYVAEVWFNMFGDGDVNLGKMTFKSMFPKSFKLGSSSIDVKFTSRGEVTLISRDDETHDTLVRRAEHARPMQITVRQNILGLHSKNPLHGLHYMLTHLMLVPQWTAKGPYFALPSADALLSAFIDRFSNGWTRDEKHQVWRVWFNGFDKKDALPTRELNKGDSAKFEFHADKYHVRLWVHGTTFEVTCGRESASLRTAINVLRDTVLRNDKGFSRHNNHVLGFTYESHSTTALANVLRVIYHMVVVLGWTYRHTNRGHDFDFPEYVAKDTMRRVPSRLSPAWENFSLELQRNMGLGALRHLPADVSRLVATSDAVALIKLAGTDRMFADVARDDRVWKYMFKRDYRAMYVWCNKRLPIMFRNVEDLFNAQQLARLLAEMPSSFRELYKWHAVDKAMPWKRFYLHTRQGYRHNQNIVFDRARKCRDATEAIKQLLRGDDDGIRVWYIQPLVDNTLTFTSEERVKFVRVLDKEASKIVHPLAPAFASVERINDVELNRGEMRRRSDQILAYYDYHARFMQAPTTLINRFDIQLPFMCCSDRLERIMIDLKNEGRGMQLTTYIQELILPRRYDRTIISDFTLFGSAFCHSLLFPADMLEGDDVLLRKAANVFIHDMISKMTAPRKYVSHNSAPLVLCKICGAADGLKWMHAEGDSETGAYCSDACAAKGLSL